MKRGVWILGLLFAALCAAGILGCKAPETEKEQAVVSLGALAATYDGTEKAALATVEPKNAGTVTVEYRLNGVRVEAPVDAGTYDVTATLESETHEAAPADGKLTVAPKSLGLKGCTAEPKIYDGTSAVTFSDNGTLTGIVEGDAVTLVRVMASAENKNVGEGKRVGFSRFVLGGADKNNYTVTAPEGVTAEIRPKQVTIGGVTIDVKQADGTTSATFTGTPVVLGAVGEDRVDVTVTKFEFLDANSGRDKKLRATARLTGDDRENYYLIDDECGVTGIIGIVSGDFLLATAGPDAYAVLAYLGGDASVTLPDAYLGKPVAEVADEAFRDDVSVTSVSVPASYRRIGEYAFAGSGIREFTFSAGSNLESIGFSAFTGSALTSVTIPASAGTIGGDAFKDSALASLAFAARDGQAPKKLTFGDRAFFGTALSSVTVPAYVSEIGYGCFQECKKLKSAEFDKSEYGIDFRNAPDGKAWTFAWSTVERIAFHGGVREIPKTFAQETRLTDLVLSEGLEKIGFCAFIFTHVTRVEIPSTVERIEEGAFKSIVELQSLTFAAGGTKPLVIEEFVFYQTSLESVALPARLSYLGWGTLAQLPLLHSVTIEQGGGTIGLVIGDDAFDLNPRLLSVSLPDRLTAYADNAFDDGCTVTGGGGKAKDRKDPALSVPRE